ncbi:hypothetical protein AVEN_261273-1 [Araneus ventricosus]|uniref:Uncharacterized protein n=1 Tax=Araneus ventricosus TaxID=182803 RepID=A0A4Y2GIR3_ARAVE|nr:hypothetical protein AVEN_261273-1 [Araneus ventricosus]
MVKPPTILAASSTLSLSSKHLQVRFALHQIIPIVWSSMVKPPTILAASSTLSLSSKHLQVRFALHQIIPIVWSSMVKPPTSLAASRLPFRFLYPLEQRFQRMGLSPLVGLGYRISGRGMLVKSQSQGNFSSRHSFFCFS